MQTRRYHWIQAEIERLDPYKDYEKIWRLSSSYGLNDFMNNLIYALTFPNFVVTEHGANVVWRDDGGKVLFKATQREEETQNNNALWWYYGPSDARTQKSIEGINRLHARWAQQYPGHFADNADYIYTLAFSAILMHRLRLRLGLAGLTPKQKIAAHLFWRDMAALFTAEGGVPLHGYPATWDGAVAFCAEYENRDRPGRTAKGHLVAEAIYGQFAFRYFPRPLHALGRAVPVALSLPTTLQAHRIEPVSPLLAWLIATVVRALFWALETLFPDPDPGAAWWLGVEEMPKDARLERGKALRRVDHAYAPFFAERHAGHWAGCPYHKALGAVADAKEKGKKSG